ncbi:MAG TPA: hypothetical protein VLL98_05380 [Rickettsiales bacterium]|nr:hypothetical protein [Rickettsiales bacterium]
MIKNNKGYNLLVLNILILVLVILMSAVLGFYNITNYKRRIFATKSRFNEIDLSIKSYVAKYNRFPCPAPLNCDESSCTDSSDSIGVEKLNSSDECDADNVGVFQSTNSSSEEIYYGGVPALTLGLPNNYVSDAWGNKIAYIIPKELTEEDSYSRFLYAKHHTDETTITIDGTDYTLTREYVKDGIVYLLISFNKNTRGAYTYENTRVNSFSGTENYPVENFTINTSNTDFLFYGKTYVNFRIPGLEEEMQVCPDLTTTDSETGASEMTFYSGKYGEVIFSEEFCPSLVNNPAQSGDYYYLSTYIDSNGILIDNRAAKKCGKNGEWIEDFIYECDLLPRCVKPVNDSRYSSLSWTNFDFTVSNMGEVQDDDNTVRLKCIYTYDDGSVWYKIN